EADLAKLTDDISYTYELPGRKRVALTVFTTTGCVSSDTLELFILPSITVTTDDFYDAEDFELTADQWIAWGDEQEDFASSWRYAPPAGNTITPLDGEAWVTNPDGTYPEDDASVIYSPCFDISGLIRPMVGFSSFTDARKGQDGAVFQYSADGRFDNWNTIGTNTSGIKWYDQADITNIPGSLESNRLAYGWSLESSGWQESKQSLRSIPVDVRSHVIFRFAFNSGPNVAFEGFAFDNFFIAERNRIVILEHFENFSDESILQTDFIEDISSDENELINLQYRAGDEPLFSSEVNARMEYYGITTAPYAIFDGTETNSEPIENWGRSAFDFRSLKSPNVRIQISNAQSNSGELSVITQVEAIEDINDPFIIITAIIERDANGLKNVMRKMLPDASGRRIEKLLKNDAPIAASYSWPLNNLDPTNELDIAIVAFVQDLGTNEILQSAIRDIDETLIVTGLDELADGTKYLLYPNPASEKVTLTFMKPVINDINLKIYDQFGKLIFTQLIKTGEYQTEISVNKYAIGVYLLQLETNSEILLRNKFIISH
ncbi:MAG: T9SS type A sorting domain-containing protein, partial [Bacteroidetes bacterium]|nr:T9SS type A sorting domain-containing protein [Bacteroidota bacterium]